MAETKKRGGRAYQANQIKQARKPIPCTLDQEPRDLLMRAARAAGIRIKEWVGNQANVIMPDGNHCGWNPLASWGGGEAMQLVLKLRLGLFPLAGGGWDVVRYDEYGSERTLTSCANSGAWALQEAIVRAAAAIPPEGGEKRGVDVPRGGEHGA